MLILVGMPGDRLLDIGPGGITPFPYPPLAAAGDIGAAGTGTGIAAAAAAAIRAASTLACALLDSRGGPAAPCRVEWRSERIFAWV